MLGPTRQAIRLRLDPDDRPERRRYQPLSAVTVFSATDAWAVGRTAPSLEGLTLAMRWNGSTWTQTPTPSPGGGDNVLAAVDGASSSDVWAVGYLRNPPYGVLRWNGTSWRSVAAPPINNLASVVALSPTNVWTVGSGDDGLPRFANWRGSGWTVEPAPSVAPRIPTIRRLAALAPGTVWAVGTTYTGTATPQPAPVAWRTGTAG